MTERVVLYDAEWLASPDCMSRMWCGAADPDPIVVQIGAVRLSLDAPFEIDETIDILIQPRGRTGEPLALDPWFADFTGLSDARLARDGVPLAEGLARFAEFAGPAPIYAWGKDEMMVMGISPYLAGIAPPLPATRFGHAGNLLVKAGYPIETFIKVRSNALGDFFNLPKRDKQAHDGLDDAIEVARAIQHLLRCGKLTASDIPLA